MKSKIKATITKKTEPPYKDLEKISFESLRLVENSKTQKERWDVAINLLSEIYQMLLGKYEKSKGEIFTQTCDKVFSVFADTYQHKSEEGEICPTKYWVRNIIFQTCSKNAPWEPSVIKASVEFGWGHPSKYADPEKYGFETETIL